MKRVAPFILGVALVVSCQKSPYPGYSVSPSGLDYKIRSLGEASEVISDSEIVTLNVRVFAPTDSVLFQGEVTKMFVNQSDTSWDEIMTLLAVGDSASVYMYNDKIMDIAGAKWAKKLRVEVGVKSKMNISSWAFYEKYPELSHDLEMEEQIQLTHLLNQYPKDSIEVVNGMFLIRDVIGSGPFPKRNDEITVHYNTYTTDDKLLDSTYDRNQPFVYVVGQQGQVLPGFDSGIRKMRKGGKATFIIPSAYAFGSEGAVSGVAREYEVLIFQVEVVDIKSPLLDGISDLKSQ